MIWECVSCYSSMCIHLCVRPLSILSCIYPSNLSSGSAYSAPSGHDHLRLATRGCGGALTAVPPHHTVSHHRSFHFPLTSSITINDKYLKSLQTLIQHRTLSSPSTLIHCSALRQRHPRTTLGSTTTLSSATTPI
jgi:hypothetical protein